MCKKCCCPKKEGFGPSCCEPEAMAFETPMLWKYWEGKDTLNRERRSMAPGFKGCHTCLPVLLTDVGLQEPKSCNSRNGWRLCGQGQGRTSLGGGRKKKTLKWGRYKYRITDSIHVRRSNVVEKGRIRFLVIRNVVSGLPSLCTDSNLTCLYFIF